MSLQYSCFISYRRNFGDEKFIKRFKQAVETAGKKAVDKSVFFDETSIDWGKDFDMKILESIFSSYYFIPLYHNAYLSLNNLWCAKELYMAIKFEHKIRETIPDFCFILPIIDSGESRDLPDCIGKKNAKEIQRRKHIFSNTGSKAYNDFLEEIYKIFYHNSKLINQETSFMDILKELEFPDDDEIISWVKQQKEIEKNNQSNHLPILTKKIA